MADPEPTPKKYELKPREFERLNAEPGMQAPSEAHDVFAIRRELREREQAAGMDNLVLGPPRRSKRKRDYWLLLVLGNVLMGGVLFAGRDNIYMLVYTFSGMVLFSVGLTWVMWQVMSDY